MKRGKGDRMENFHITENEKDRKILNINWEMKEMEERKGNLIRG